MKDIISFLNSKHDKFDPEYWSKENYLLNNISEFFNNDIPNNIKEKLMNDEYVDYIFETLKTHDTDKLKEKLIKEYGDLITIDDYSEGKKRSINITLNKEAKAYDFVSTNTKLDNTEKIEKFNNILAFYNYYVSYSDRRNDEFIIFIEPRYSDDVTDEIYDNHMTLYHFTDGKSAESILKNGLRVKKSKYREFPERIFLYATEKNLLDDIKNVTQFILKVRNAQLMYKYGLAILKIKNNHKFTIYKDTAMKDEEAVFVYENIPAEFISKVDTKLTYKEVCKYYED